jgi:predicted lipid-binding transport protein (Tim44 family)
VKSVPVSFQIIAFAIIAAVLLFALYNVLGKKVGIQPGEMKPKAKAGPGFGRMPTPGANNTPAVPAIDPATAAAIAGLKSRDPSFDPNRFLEGARQAYETIVRAYAAGDRETLRPLLTRSVLTSFEGGIDAREARGEREQVEFIVPARADIEEATVRDERAVAKVRFLAELRSTHTPAEGEAKVDERRTAEVWTFERALGAADPNWALARVEAAAA